MNDEFLHRIRKDPSPRFLASLKRRLADEIPVQNRRMPRRGLIIVGVIVGVALASGIYFAQTPRVAKSMSALESDTASSPHMQMPAPLEVSGPATTVKPDLVNAVEGKPMSVTTPSRQFGMAATVAVYPMLKAAWGYMNKNIYPYSPATDPTFSLKSPEIIFASLCAVDASVQAIVTERRILPEELAVCRSRQRHIAELPLGYEVVTVVSSNLYPRPRLSARALFLGIAHDVPDPLGTERLIPNPYVTWDEVDPSLPNERIDVFGPPTSSATGMAFRDRILKSGCNTLPTIAALKDSAPERYEVVCGSVRTDGHYRPKESVSGAAQSPSVFLGYLQANPGSLAVMSFAEASASATNLSAASIDDVIPTRPTIASGAYVGARPLYLYTDKSMQAARGFAIALSIIVGGVFADATVAPLLAPLDPVEQRSLRDLALTLPEL